MSWKKEGPAVYRAAGQQAVSSADVARLKKMAPKSGRVRLCLHAGAAAKVQEMIIALRRGEYVRPHRHQAAGETYHVLEGDVMFFEFDGRGRVTRRARASAKSSKASFLYRQRAGLWHGLLVLSPWLVFRETKAGPFRPSQSRFAPWSPEPTDDAGVKSYLSRLKRAAGGLR